MATGIVSTARGEVLNLDDLIAKAKRPVGLKEAASTRAKPNYSPEASNTPRVRGFVPAAGSRREEDPGIDETFVPSTPKAGPVISRVTPEGGNPTLADLTGVTVSKSARLKAKAEAPTEAPVESDDELGSLLSELNDPTK